MIQVRHITDVVSGKTIDRVRIEGPAPLSSIVREGAVSAIVDDQIYKRSDFDSVTIRDGADVAIVYTHSDPISIGAIALTVLISVAISALKLGIIAGVLYGLYKGFSYLASAIGEALAPDIPGFGGGSGGQSTGNNFERPATSSQQGTTIPVVYGQAQTGGMIIQQYTRAEADKSLALYTVLALSYGPIEQIGEGAVVYTTDQDGLTGDAIPTGLTINDLNVRDLPSAQVSLRMGSDSQTVPTDWLWSSQMIQYDYNFRLNFGTTFRYEGRDPCEAFWINLSFPSGLFRVTGGGLLSSQLITVQVVVRRKSDNGIEQTIVRQFSDKKQSSFFESIFIEGLSFQGYRLEISRTSPPFDNDAGDEKQRRLDCDVIGIVEKNFAPVAYRGVALLTMKVKSNDSIGGGQTRIRCVIKGRNTIFDPRDNSTGYTDNPALCIRDLMLSTEYGGGRRLTADNIGISFNDYADWCDDLVPTFKGSSVTEKRHVIGANIDTRFKLWEIVSSMCSQTRCIPTRLGDVVDFVLQNQKATTQVFTPGNIAEFAGPQITYANPSLRFNRVTVRYRNTSNWEMDFISARVENAVESDEVQEMELDAPFITRRSEAARLAYFELEKQQSIGKSVAITTGLDGIAAELGSIIEVTSGYISSGGRIVDIDPGVSITLDRQVPLDTGVVYTLTERQADGTLVNFEFAGTGTTTDVIPVAPDTDTEIGNVWRLIQESSDRELYMVMRFSKSDEATRQIEAVQYVPEAYADALNPPEEDDVFEPVTPPAPAAVADLAVVRESFELIGQSRLYVEWSASAGAVLYSVYVESISINDQPRLAATVSDPAAEIIVAATWGERINVTVVAIGQANSQLAYESSASVALTCQRDDESQAVAVFPSTAANLVYTNGSGNEASLSWDASTIVRSVKTTTGDTINPIIITTIGNHGVMTGDSVTVSGVTGNTNANGTFVATRIDDVSFSVSATGNGAYVSGGSVSVPATGYEIRLAEWHDGKTLGITSASSLSILRNAIQTGVRVRAFKELATNGTRYYSPGVNPAVWLPAVPSGFSSTVAGVSFRYASLVNGAPVEYFTGTFGRAALQISEASPIIWRTETVDGGAVDNFFCSLDIRVFPYHLTTANDDLFLSMDHIAWTGQTNKRYVDWVVTLSYSQDGTNFTSVDVTAKLESQQNIIAFGRYFYAEIAAKPVDESVRPDSPSPYLAAIPRVELAINQEL